MNTDLNLFGNLRHGLGCVGELLGYLLRFVSMFFRTRASLTAPEPAPTPPVNARLQRAVMLTDSPG